MADVPGSRPSFVASVVVDGVATDTPSPPRYGVFYEDYNHGGDGGLYAEMVRNASFATGDECWTVTGGTARADTDNDGYPCLRVTCPGPQVSIVNAGFWGMRVRSGAQYRLTVFADTRGFEGKLGALLRDPSGACVASSALDVSEGAAASAILTACADVEAAQLVLILSGTGELVLSHVSLMPVETWRGLPLRLDLADAIAALQPAFVRFPGGCNLAGVTPERCIRWKESLGPVHRRRGVHQIWDYHITEGLGFHELLLWCEALGAEPWLTVNCGMMAHWHSPNVVPLEELDVWVQDALDAIEYCNGSPATRWGAERAQRGHPEPFGLRVIEIGNEHSGPRYDERFARFYDAIKARHPDIAVVANFPVAGRSPDVIDEHFYGCPQRLIAQPNRIARRGASEPSLAVTEYGVTSEATWRGALAEAAFLVGAENYAGVVKNICHGALWRNLNDPAPCWPINTLHFDGERVIPQPTYWVQKAFNQQRGVAVLPVRVTTDLAGGEGEAGPGNIGVWQPPRAGRIGLGAANADAEFCDLSITDADGRTLLRLPGPITPEQGNVAHLHRTGPVGLWGSEDTRDCTVRVRARKTGGAEGFQIYVRVQDDKNYLVLRMGIWNNTRHSIDGCVAGRTDTLDLEVPFALETGRWYDVAVTVQGDNGRLIVTLDGQTLWDYAHPVPSALCVTASRALPEDIILKAVNLCGIAASTQVQIAGVTGRFSGEIRTYGADLDAANPASAATSASLSPTVTHSAISAWNAAAPLCITVPPHSLTIVRLHHLKPE